MARTTFQDAVPATPIVAEWLNGVDDHVFGVGAVNVITQAPTTSFFQSQGAKVNRLDRLLVGGACVNDAEIPGPLSVPDWLTAFQLSTGRTLGFVEFAQQSILTTESQYSVSGAVVGAQTKHFAGVGNAIPITTIGVNNNTTYTTNTFGIYSEAFNMPGVLGAAFGMEIDTVNYRGAATITPYAQHNQEVVALQLAAGAELSPTGQFSSSAAINIWNNNSTFDRGIVFGSSAISGATGTAGTGTAIAFGQGHTMQWFGSASAPTSSIVCNVPAADAASALSINFASNGMKIQMPGGQVVANFIPLASIANYFQFVPATAGNSIQIQAQGTDANIHLSLVPKGSGRIQFGAYTGGAPVATGYITILDNTGTPRKILVG